MKALASLLLLTGLGLGAGLRRNSAIHGRRPDADPAEGSADWPPRESHLNWGIDALEAQDDIDYFLLQDRPSLMTRWNVE